MTGKRKLKKKIKLRFDEGQNCNIDFFFLNPLNIHYSFE